MLITRARFLVKMLSLIISQLKTEMIMLCMYYTIALNVLIFQNCKMADSFSSSDEDGLTCLLDVVGVGGGERCPEMILQKM